MSRDEILAALRRGVDAFESASVPDRDVAKGLRVLADKIDPPKDLDQVKLVFERWVAILGKDPKRSKLTKDRQAKVRARIKEGYTVADIVVAIQNLAGSSFHRGENDRGQAYDDLTLICRTGSKLEQFRDMGPHRVGDAPPQAATPMRQQQGYKHTTW